ncbi:hypothetical protein [uncultured Pseudodesulfovibrio sp.]|uniref:hypothetical protein n=1 Tax=uncultured Pseudodesulfovibrio sp. TaxID=2035858 RepID=UPI0029C763CE|nr:hypothetical protein [uncultured Pseudodesulfovibrio sp.]
MLARIWRGEEGLARTFWGWGFAVNIVLKGISLLLLAVAGQRSGFELVLLAFLLFMIAYQVFISVAIWRSANRYEGNRAWRFLAKAVVVLGAIQTVFSLFGIA